VQKILFLAGLLVCTPVWADLPDCEKCIASPDIAAKAVTSGKIAPDAVTRSKLAPGSVGRSEIMDGSITPEKLSEPLAEAARLSLVVVDATGREIPFIPLGAYDYLDANYGPVSYWDGLFNVRDKMLVQLRFERDAIYAYRPGRLYYSEANCSGSVYLDIELPYSGGTLGYPLLSPKAFVIGGSRYEAPLEVFTMGETFRDGTAAQSFRDIGAYAPIANPRDGLFEDPYDRPVTDTIPQYIQDVCINELAFLDKARLLNFEMEIEVTLPLSLKMR